MASDAITRYTGVIKPRASPSGGGVAGVAFRSGGDMTSTFSSCGSTIVATRARTYNLSVIDARRGPPYSGGVAGLALRGCIDVRKRFAGGIDAVVAGDTTGCNASMVECCACPSRRIVAGIANSGGRNMIRTLAARDRAIMAACAGANNLAVINA